MEIRHLTVILILIQSLLLLSCSKGKQFQAATTPAKTTYSPPKPVIYEQQGLKFIRGATQVDNVHVTVFQDLKSIQLSAKIDFFHLNGAHLKKVQVLMNGTMDKDGFIVLNQDPNIARILKNENIKIAAKATCLSDDNTCTHSFIDIYGYIDKNVYHHQIESNMSEVDITQLTGKKSKSPPQESSQTNLGIEADLTEESDGFEDADGYYVGSITEDIQHLIFEDQTVSNENTNLQSNKNKQEIGNSANSDINGKKPVPKDTKSIPFSEQVLSSRGKATVGSLHNAIDVLEYEKKNSPTGFRILYPQNGAYYATSELTYVLAQMGWFTKKNVAPYVLGIGDISRKNGGQLGGHKSHQQGLDVDVSYFIRNQYNPRVLQDIVQNAKPNKDWMIEKQWELFKFTVGLNYVDRILVDSTLKNALCKLAKEKSELNNTSKSVNIAFQTLRRLRVVSNHQDHFHLRVRCSVLQVRCRMMAEPPQSTECP